MLFATLSILLLASDVYAVNYFNASDGEGMVVAVGMPKSGTTSLFGFLNQLDGDYSATHWTSKKCNHSMYPIPALRLQNVTWKAIEHGDNRTSNMEGHCYNGVQIQRAMVDGRPPLSYLMQNGINAVVQMDVITHDLNIWPQIDALEPILDAYPRARYVHHIRNITEHVSSINRWSDL
ncbi:hypothetical protein B484DRAFT_411831, partial [Ochromonadaceae sp. CCMP2298]